MKNTSTTWKRSSALILSGVINAFILIVRTPLFWQINRTMRVILLIISSAFLSIIYLYIFNFLKRTPEKQSKNFVLLLVGFHFLFCCYLIVRNNFPEEAVTLWLRGLGRPLIKTADIIFFLIVIMYVCRLYLSEMNSVVFQLNEKHIYDIVFVSSFFLICLLPLKNVTDVNSLDESFWGRDTLINTFQSIRLGIGDRVFEKSIRADNNWLIYTGEISVQDYQNTIPLNENQLEKIYANLDTLNAYLQSKEISLLVVIPPNKNTIYPEYMPDEIPVIGEISRLDQVINYQKEHNGVEILDLRPVLFEAKQEKQVFYALDTHWNLFGAFFAYQEIINALNKQFLNLKPYDINSFEFNPIGKGPGDLANMSQIKMVEEHYELKYKEVDVTKINKIIFYYSTNKSAPIPLTIYVNEDELLPDIFIYHDSFSDNLKYFLPLNFHKTTFLHHLNNNLELAQIDADNPDIVLVEFTERYLSCLLYNLPE